MDAVVARLQRALRGNTARELDFDVLLTIMDFLADERPSLAACTLVCYTWFFPARRALFRIIYLQGIPTEYEPFLQGLNSFELNDTIRPGPRRRLQFDFRPHVQELHLLGNSPFADRRMLAIHRRAQWEDVLTLRIHHILQIIRHLPNLHVADFRNPSSFFCPRLGTGAMWSLFWALAPHVEELRLENKWSLAEYEADAIRLDMEKALNYPAPCPPASSKLRSLSMDNFDSAGLPQFWGELTNLGPTIPVIACLTVPVTVLATANFERVLAHIGRYLKYLRFDLIKPVTQFGETIPCNAIQGLSSCVKLSSLELGCKSPFLCQPRSLFDLAQRLILVLPPRSRTNIVINLGAHDIWDTKSLSSVRLGHAPSPGDWISWFWDEHTSFDELAAAHEFLRTLSFRVSVVEVESSVRKTFPRTDQAGKLYVGVR